MGGIMDYRARFYSPALGRFIQPDTIIPNAANPQAFNRFTYVLNDPIRFNDPTGHVCSDPEDPSPTCDGSFLETTKVGNKMVKGTGLDAGKPKVKKSKPSVDWEEVADDLLEMADNINTDLGLEAASALITAGLTAAGGYVAGSLGICPASGPMTPICTILGAVGGFFTGVATESLLKNDATVYQTLARTILQNLDDGKLDLTMFHKPTANYILESPPNERPYKTPVHVPEHYVLQNANGTYLPITPAHYEVLWSIIRSNTGP